MAVLGIGKGREDGEGNLFRVITHEASKPVFKDDGGPSAIDKRFLDESIEKRCGFSVDVQRITWSSVFKRLAMEFAISTTMEISLSPEMPHMSIRRLVDRG